MQTRIDTKTSRTTTSATHAIAAYKILDGITKNGSGGEEGVGAREVVDIEREVNFRAAEIVEAAEDCMKPVALGRIGSVHPTPMEIGSQQL